jgi:protein-tyrosine phosphatase
VCHGNVCRSPYAAEVARQRGLAGEIISRGFIGPDRPSPEAALRAAERRGVDLRSHRSRLIAAAEFRAGDVVFVMNGKQASAIRSLAAVPSVTVLILGDFDPLPVARREIPDPWGRSDAEFDESYARIDRCLDVVANALVG